MSNGRRSSCAGSRRRADSVIISEEINGWLRLSASGWLARDRYTLRGGALEFGSLLDNCKWLYKVRLGVERE